MSYPKKGLWLQTKNGRKSFVFQEEYDLVKKDIEQDCTASEVQEHLKEAGLRYHYQIYYMVRHGKIIERNVVATDRQLNALRRARGEVGEGGEGAFILLRKTSSGIVPVKYSEVVEDDSGGHRYILFSL